MQIRTKIVSCHTADSKPVKQEVNGKVILSPLVLPVLSYTQNFIRSNINLNQRSLNHLSLYYMPFDCMLLPLDHMPLYHMLLYYILLHEMLLAEQSNNNL